MKPRVGSQCLPPQPAPTPVYSKAAKHGVVRKKAGRDPAVDCATGLSIDLLYFYKKLESQDLI